MELRHLLLVIRRSSRFLVGSTLVAGLLAIAATYVLPEKYDATTSILIRPRREPSGDGAAKTLLDYPVSFNIPIDSMAKTYAEIMDSQAVARRVVDLLHLDTLKPPRDPRWYVQLLHDARDRGRTAVVRTWEFLRYGRVEPKDPYREAVNNVVAGLAAKPVTDTFLFSLTATARDPQLAARIANTAAAVFIDYTRDARMNEEGSGARDIATRLGTVQTRLGEARGRLEAFGHDTTAASLDRDLQLQLDDLEKFQAERQETAKQVAGYTAEIGTLATELASQQEAVPSSTTVARNPVVTQIEEALAKFQVEYAGLSSTLEPDHPRMRELRAQIAEARARLAAAVHQVPDKQTSARNSVYDDINRKLLDREAARNAARAHLAALDATIARYRAQTDELAGQKGDLARLTFDVDVLENEYRLLDHEHAEAAVAAVQQIGEIRQLSAATPPVYPSRPIKIYYAAAGTAIGFLAALLLVLLVDYTDPRVYEVESLQHRLDVPLVSIIPRLAPAGTDAIARLGRPLGLGAIAARPRDRHDH